MVVTEDDSRCHDRQHGLMAARRVTALPLALLLAVGALPALGIGPAAAATSTLLEQRYTLRATLDYASAHLDVEEELALTNRSSQVVDHVDLSVIPQAFGYFTMLAPVTVDAETAEISWTTSTNLQVPLPAPLHRDDTATIHLAFALDLGLSPEAFRARLSAENGVLSVGQWFPILSREHDVYGLGDPQVSFTAETIRLELTTTTPLPRDAVACAGLSSAPVTEGTSWTCEVDRVRDFAFAVNPAYRLTSRTVDDTEIRVYTQTVDGGATADLAQQAFIGLEDAYGAYPWSDLVLAEAGTGNGFSIEFPRQVHLTRSKVTDVYVVFHEVAHQWFYAQLGNDQMASPWLDEAFADFSARYLMGIGTDACSSRDVDSPVFAWAAGTTDGGDWTSCDGYFHAVFYRGSEFLNAVRTTMGDDAFFGALRSLFEQRRFGIITTRGLLKRFDDATSADLRPLFTTYLAAWDGRTIADLAKSRLAG
jgi:hypothetical protein